MSEHRFKTGQMVFFHPKHRIVDAPTNRPFQISALIPALMPPLDGEPQYRIKSSYVEHEYAARESELRLVQAYTS
jgi:hypothetical protein